METVKTTTSTTTATPAAVQSGKDSEKKMSGSPLFIQPKLTIGSPDDPLEKEADDMADKVMRMAMPEAINFSYAKNSVQRKCAHCEEEEKQLQRKENSNDSVSVAPSIVHDVINSSGGRSLDADSRSFMEPRFNYDFSNVKIHDSDSGAKSAASINALAYTSGNNIVFNSGQYNTTSDSGKRLLAHELTHVMQQESSVPRKTIQRQDADLFDSTPSQQPSGPPIPTLVATPLRTEPSCPSMGTNLGSLIPSPPCNNVGDHLDNGEIFHFCKDSDIIINNNELIRLVTFAQRQPSLTQFHVRSYASTEGPGTQSAVVIYNERLSCHRAKRITRELINAGVQETRIDTVAMGPTERFGSGPSNRPLNRVVVVGVTIPGSSPTPSNPTNVTEVVNQAKQRLINREYSLGADAYFARWTCGRFNSLGEAVERTNIVVTHALITTPANQEIGTVGLQGQNTINLDDRINDATDPVGCASNRIADLTFHHFARPCLPVFADQHQGGLYMLFLGGFNACSIPQDPMGGHIIQHSIPRSTDPKAGFQPPCADTPLPGSITPQVQNQPLPPPAFTLPRINVQNTGAGSMSPVPSSPFSVGLEPANAMQLDGEVTVTGDQREINNYEIGFLQTVMEERFITTFVDGKRVVYRFPLPLRDGAPFGDPFSNPPWFDRNSKSQAKSGIVNATMTDIPHLRVFRFFPDPNQTRFIFRGPHQGQTLDFSIFDFSNANHNDVPDRAERELSFNTWLVARRKNAPATIDSTSFLTGVRMVLHMNGSWVGQGGILTGTGNYTFSSQTASSGDQSSMRLRGATPLDFMSPQGIPLANEYLQFENALPISQAGGLNLSQYSLELNNIARSFRNTPAIKQALVARIRIDLATGRVILDSDILSAGAIRIAAATGNILSANDAVILAREIFPEVRKLVAGRLTPNQPQSGIQTLAFALHPLP